MTTPRDALRKLMADYGPSQPAAASGNTGLAPDQPAIWTPRRLLTDKEITQAGEVPTWPQRFVQYARSRTDAPASFLEAAALAALSVTLGRKPRLQLTTGMVIPTLWVMLVADTTRHRKSTAINLAVEVLKPAVSDALAPDDFTPQRLISLMAERSGKPTLFRRDELGGFYEGLNKLEYQAGGKQVLISCHDGRDFHKPESTEGHRWTA